MGGCLMSVITYWQGELRLAGDIGVCAEAATLVQDEATAAVMIAAILVRNFAPGQWPSWYRARIEAPGGVAVVTEDDARVRLARLLLANRERPALTACALATVRAGVLASLLGERAESALVSEGPDAMTGYQERCGG